MILREWKHGSECPLSPTLAKNDSKPRESYKDERSRDRGSTSCDSTLNMQDLLPVSQSSFPLKWDEMEGFTMKSWSLRSQILASTYNCHWRKLLSSSLIGIHEKIIKGITEEVIMNASMNKEGDIPQRKLWFLIPENERKKCRERERERDAAYCCTINWNLIPSETNTWPKQKTGTKGRPFTIDMRTNPLRALRKTIYQEKSSICFVISMKQITI